MTRDDSFRIRPGRIGHGNRGDKRPQTFVGEVMRAAKKAGHVGNGFRSRTARSGSRFGRGRRAAMSIRLRSNARRVVTKARVVRHHGVKTRAILTPTLKPSIALISLQIVEIFGVAFRVHMTPPRNRIHAYYQWHASTLGGVAIGRDFTTVHPLRDRRHSFRRLTSLRMSLKVIPARSRRKSFRSDLLQTGHSAGARARTDDGGFVVTKGHKP